MARVRYTQEVITEVLMRMVATNQTAERVCDGGEFGNYKALYHAFARWGISLAYSAPRCKEHSKYMAVLKPKVECVACEIIYNAKHNSPQVIVPERKIEIVERPFAVPLAGPVVVEEGPDLIQRGIILGDSHAQFIDERAEAIALQIIEDFQPHTVVHNGDATDCYLLSKFDQDPDRLESLDDELEATRAHLWRIANAAPDAKRYLLEGNHEDRLRRAMWSSHTHQRAIFQLRDVQEALTWPSLLHLDEIGFEWVDRKVQHKTKIFPKFLNKHGTIIRKWSAYTARGEHEQYGISGASGHTHRLGMYMQKDHNGNHMWWESGCLCKLNPDYVPGEPNWQQGFLTCDFDLETGAPHISAVYIHNGGTVWRGRRYRA